jgi:hypothetical protein
MAALAYCRPQYGDENLSTRFLQERRRLRSRNRLGKLDELIAISEEFRPGIAIDLNELDSPRPKLSLNLNAPRETCEGRGTLLSRHRNSLETLPGSDE